MFDPANAVSVLVPMLAVVALTFIAFVKMGGARAGAMKAMDPNFYRAHQGGQEPEAAATAVRHYNNLFELPTLFYAGCLTAYALGAVSTWTLGFAWAYVAFRVVQSGVHLTYNNPAHRGFAFILGLLMVFALWINIGMAIFARL